MNPQDLLYTNEFLNTNINKDINLNDDVINNKIEKNDIEKNDIENINNYLRKCFGIRKFLKKFFSSVIFVKHVYFWIMFS